MMRIVVDNTGKDNGSTCPKESFNWEHPRGCDEVCKPEPFAEICWGIFYGKETKTP